MPNHDGIPTWEDFKDFYDNPLIQRISSYKKWTVSDKEKRPIDMYALINYGKIWGLANDRGHTPFVDLPTLCATLPSAKNNAYFLDALIDGFVVLDIEPKCPDVIKQKLMELPYLYGEVSMSGKGIHLLFDLPEHILEKYPVAQNKMALKEEHGYYEILLNHMVTFTRNTLPVKNTGENISSFENIFEILASKVKDTGNNLKVIPVTDIDENEIPYYNTLMATLTAQDYSKNLADFHGDNSRYEYGMAGFYYRLLSHLLTNGSYKDHTYTDEEKVMIVYKLISDKLEYRPKHDQFRNNMPWLMFVANNLVAKSDT